MNEPEPPPTDEEVRAFVAWGEEDGGFPAGAPEPLPELIAFHGVCLADLRGDALKEWRAFVKEHCS